MMFIRKLASLVLVGSLAYASAGFGADKAGSADYPGIGRFEGSEIARTRRWLITRADSIWGGTSEIQRNIIAKRVLLIPE